MNAAAEKRINEIQETYAAFFESDEAIAQQEEVVADIVTELALIAQRNLHQRLSPAQVGQQFRDCLYSKLDVLARSCYAIGFVVGSTMEQVSLENAMKEFLTRFDALAGDVGADAGDAGDGDDAVIECDCISCVAGRLETGWSPLDKEEEEEDDTILDSNDYIDEDIDEDIDHKGGSAPFGGGTYPIFAENKPEAFVEVFEDETVVNYFIAIGSHLQASSAIVRIGNQRDIEAIRARAGFVGTFDFTPALS